MEMPDGKSENKKLYTVLIFYGDIFEYLYFLLKGSFWHEHRKFISLCFKKCVRYLVHQQGRKPWLECIKTQINLKHNILKKQKKKKKLGMIAGTPSQFFADAYIKIYAILFWPRRQKIFKQKFQGYFLLTGIILSFSVSLKLAYVIICHKANSTWFHSE